MDPPRLRAANDLSRRGRETGLDCRVAAPEVRRPYLYLTVSTYCEWLVPRGSARNFARPGLTGPPGENGGASLETATGFFLDKGSPCEVTRLDPQLRPGIPGMSLGARMRGTPYHVGSNAVDGDLGYGGGYALFCT